MTFDDVLEQVIQLLQRQGRVSYRSLKRRFALDDDYLEDLKEELIHAQRVATDEDGRILVWTGNARTTLSPVSRSVATARNGVGRSSKLLRRATGSVSRRNVSVSFCP